MNRKEEEINKSILEWLISKNYSNAVEGFIKDTGMKKEDATKGSRLEKKWGAILILQKKISDYEAQIKQLKEDLESGGGGIGLAKKNAESMGLPKSVAKATIRGHRQAITCVAFHPIYKRLVSGSEDATIIVWECDEFTQETSLRAHSNVVNFITFDESGKLMASCSSDMNVKIWNFETMTCMRTLSGHEHSVSCIEFTKDGNFLYSASRDKTIKFWEISSGNCKRTFEGHDEWVRSVSLNDKGNLLASAGDDEAIIIWQTDTGAQLNVFKEHENKIERAIFLKNPKSKESVISADYFKNAKTNTSTNNPEENDKTEEDQINEKFQDKLKFIKEKDSLMNKDFVLSAARDKKIILWDVTSGVMVKTFIGHDNWVRDITEHPNGKYFVSCSEDKSIRVWEIKTGNSAKKINEAHDRFVVCIAMSPKCKMLASGSNDLTIKVWDCS